jgi:hypothetical protein
MNGVSDPVRYVQKKEMDRIECYISGKRIAPGYIQSRYGHDILCHDDDFEKPSSMFQTHLNAVVPNSENMPPGFTKLELARLKLRHIA